MSTMGEPEDEELVRILIEEERTEIFGQLVHRHLGRIRSVVYQMVLNDADADELTQEIFLRAFKGIEGFQKKARFSTWLYRIALNTTRRFLAKNAKAPLQVGEGMMERIDAAASTPETALLAGELSREITLGLASLSPKLRAAVVLTSIQGMGIREAAEIEGCTVATLYWRIHKARRILGSRLQGYLET